MRRRRAFATQVCIFFRSAAFDFMQPSSRPASALSTAEPLPPAQRLCTACGLCCDGTLFDHGTLQPGEAAQLPPEIQLLTVEGNAAFAQPCAAHRGGCCTLYDGGRPQVCSTFRCRLLRACERGGQSWERAHALVREIRAAADRLRVALDADGAQTLRHAYQAFLATHGHDDDPRAFRHRHGRLMLDYAALQVLLNSSFRPTPMKPEQTVPLPMD